MNILPEWPPNSPDLNPIEQLWGIMKKISKKRTMTSLLEFKEILQEIWDSISMNVINNLVKSFQKRIQMCLQYGGCSIQVFIRNNLNSIPSKLICNEEQLPHLWTQEEDYILESLVQRYGKKWSIITQFFVNKTSMEIKNRYKIIQMSLDRKYPLREIPPIHHIISLIEK